jgi:hypothetical protein
MERNSANTASKVIPRSRSGSEINQTIGNRTSARSATGQHSTNKRHQPTNKIRAFISLMKEPRKRLKSFGLLALEFHRDAGFTSR